MTYFISKENVTENINKFINEREISLDILRSKTESHFKSKAVYFGGSIAYGLNNHYSDVDLLVVVESNNQEIPAQLTQIDINNTRIDCRLISFQKLSSAVKNIIEKANVILNNKSPLRLGIRNEELEALDRIRNGMLITGTDLCLAPYISPLSIILVFDRQNDYYGIYQDSIGALLSGHLLYSYSRALECAAKNVDIFLALNGYINPSVKSRIIVLEKYYPTNRVTKWYKSLIVRNRTSNLDRIEISDLLREINYYNTEFQLMKIDLFKKHNEFKFYESIQNKC
ncbi:nucleotidyltransferase domain-containing protein [Atlantibacter sp.]|uniref:nucleotidyltransferase domain-containing protein n=1 Tax=Atlantibacter sp. TaxID=1903473 RepID=UPI0028AD3AB8|nr:nucleotidyltransferase domain-containing protein [Atlantibacter sp.]